MIKEITKHWIRSALRGLGFEIRRTKRAPCELGAEQDALMLGALTFSSPLKIVQIGANDGSINDPIYKFCMKHKQNTQVLLIEPQPALLPFLRKNYENHPHHCIHQGAIGSGNKITLFGVKREYWDDVNVPYAKGWPSYRAPTGITSSNRNHVEKWLKAHMKRPAQANDAIERIEVPCANLGEVVDQTGFPGKIDVLQVDAESMDDVVIYNSSVEVLKPRIIAFEAGHLPEARLSELKAFLMDKNYSVYRVRFDAIAVLEPL